MMRNLLLAVIATAVVASCSSDSEVSLCPDNIASFSQDYTVTGIEGIVVSNRSGDVVEDESTPIQIADLVLTVNLAMTESSSDSVSGNRNVSSMLASLFIKPAYACSPRGHRLTSKVVGMSLISNAALGASYPPGTSLDNLFFADALEAHIFENGYTPPMLLADISQTNRLADSGSYSVTSGAMSNGQNSELHRFTLTIAIDDGQSFSLDTDSILLLTGG